MAIDPVFVGNKYFLTTNKKQFNHILWLIYRILIPYYIQPNGQISSFVKFSTEKVKPFCGPSSIQTGSNTKLTILNGQLKYLFHNIDEKADLYAVQIWSLAGQYQVFGLLYELAKIYQPCVELYSKYLTPSKLVSMKSAKFSIVCVFEWCLKV